MLTLIQKSAHHVNYLVVVNTLPPTLSVTQSVKAEQRAAHSVSLFTDKHSFTLCCGSILSLVQIFFSFVLGIVMYDNEFETRENKI